MTTSTYTITDAETGETVAAGIEPADIEDALRGHLDEVMTAAADDDHEIPDDIDRAITALASRLARREYTGGAEEYLGVRVEVDR